MKRYILLLLMLLVVAAPLYGQPSAPDRFAIKVGATPLFAIDRLGDLADYGYGAALGLELRPFSTMPEMSLQLHGHYQMLKAREDNGSDLTIVAGTAAIKLTPSWQSESRVYLFAAGGLATIELKDPADGTYLVDSLTSESKPLVEIGLGMERKGLTGLGYFVELAGVNIISDRFGDYRYGRLTFGIIF